MMFALGAATSVIDSLFGLVSSKQTQSAGSGQDQSNLFAFQTDAATSTGTSAAPAAGRGAQLSPETWSALLAAQSQSGSPFVPISSGDALKDMFLHVDADRDGKITKSEFEDAFGAGGTNLTQADEVFGKLDRDGDGSVSETELASAMLTRHRHQGGHDAAEGAGSDSNDPLQRALDGAGGTNVTNVDGLTVTMTRPTASNAPTAAISSYNFLEQMIQRQANAIAAQGSSSLSVSV